MSTAQSLTLSVQGERGERTGGQREHVFDCRDGSIGRSDECDWVLGAEGVSRLHALVRYLNGLYFIEDRSTNGMLLNGTALGKGDPAALKHGDRLQIDTFEISVCLSGETKMQWTEPGAQAGAVSLHTLSAASSSSQASPSASASASRSSQNGDALDPGLLRGPALNEPARDDGHDDGLIPGAAGAGAAGASLDPLALFDAPPSYYDVATSAEPPAQGWSHTPAVSDRFRPPQIEALRTSGPLLPDDWDRTGSRVAPPAEAQHDDSLAAPAVRVASDSTQGEPTCAPPVAGQPQQPQQPQQAQQAQQPAAPGVSALPAMPTPAPQPLPSPTLRPDMAPSSLTASPPAAAPAPAIDTPSVEPSAPARPVPLTGAAPPDLSEMFHIAVDAMMDVLRARAELKNSFRLPATLIQRSENNPLKFAPTAQDAVTKLFAPPDSGFLSGSAALIDAADDIRNHQMAMLSGVRSAFQSVLTHFDPARIEQETEGHARRLPLGGRPRHWERYKEQFDALTRNPDECFRRLFGDEFARAYEEQLGRLKKRRK